MTLQQVTDTLNQQGWRSPKQLGAFSKDMVNTLLIRNGVKTSNKKTLSAEINRRQNEFTFRELSQKINVPQPTLYRWMQKEELKVRKATNTSERWVWLITADAQETKRLISLREKPKQWIYNSRVKKVD